MEGALYGKDYILVSLVCIFGRNSLCFERSEWDGVVQMDGGRILMGGKFLCGGRTLLEGLHTRFARMHIWAVIRFAQTAQTKTRS
ncbi:hypothetical protein HCA89_14955 [Listeria innocua]|uniref:Uncharacterized protein n=1 Tax=Listeria innocua TaxID=1642 RepID=A0AB73HBQ5_LISIO|nr:hypothetical protein [Listeria innocua]